MAASFLMCAPALAQAAELVKYVFQHMFAQVNMATPNHPLIP